MPAVLSVIIGIFLWVAAVILLIYGWTSRNFNTHIVYADGKDSTISGEGKTVLVAIGIIAGIIQFVLSVLRIMEMEYMAFAVAFFIAAVLAKTFTKGGALVLEALMFLYYGAFFILPEKMFAEFFGCITDEAHCSVICDCVCDLQYQDDSSLQGRGT